MTIRREMASAVMATMLIGVVAGVSGCGKAPHPSAASTGGTSDSVPSVTAPTTAMAVTTTVPEAPPTLGLTGSNVATSAVPAPPPTVADATAGGFLTPTGNIGCFVYVDSGARCDIVNRQWSPPPRPADCPLEYGQGLEVSGDGAHFVCAGDTAIDPRSRRVRYGTSVQQVPYACEVETSGVTCTDSATGHGFFISSGSYRIF